MVRLKSLELLGFKSFGAKTKIDFDDHLTVIIGPNGSGKSNIVDALLWAIGEREGKNLRINKNEDLIFHSPHSEYKKTGLAWVKLTFNTDNRNFEIKRKITKDGLSESYINRDKITLKELIEFLAKYRINSKGLNIIRQGESEKFIQANGFEKRLLLENILGIKVYQLKKHQAELKLNQINRNLETAEIAFKELSPRYRSLKWQLARYQKREEIEENLKDKLYSYFALKLLLLESQKPAEIDPEKIAQENAILSKKILSLQKLNSELGGKLNQVRKERAELEKKLNYLSDQKNNFLKSLGIIEGKLSFYQKEERKDQSIDSFSSTIQLEKKSLIELTSTIKELGQEILSLSDLASIKELAKKILSLLETFTSRFLEEKEEKKEEMLSQKEEIQKNVENLEKEKRNLEEEIDKINGEKSSIEEKINNLNKKESFLNEELEKGWQKISELKESLFKNREILNLHQQRNLFFEEKKKEIEEEIQQENLNLEKLKIVINKIKEQEEPPTQDKLNNLKSQISKLKTQLATIGQLDESFIKEAKEVENRYLLLKKEIEDAQKAKENLTKLIKSLEKEIEKTFEEGIAKINQQLEKISPFIFPKGEIKLVNFKKEIDGEEKNYLEIEIVWKKKVIKNINILSGGEKTLVALAILTSIALSCQPPFIVLDEIDASLDTSNSKKIAQILNDISKTTQIILITHNQITAQIAKALYGVVLAKEGFSKIISYKL